MGSKMYFLFFRQKFNLPLFVSSFFLFCFVVVVVFFREKLLLSQLRVIQFGL